MKIEHLWLNECCLTPGLQSELKMKDYEDDNGQQGSDRGSEMAKAR